MAETIPNLWPEQFKIDIQTPYTILRVQAGLLSKVTRGILEGAVETEAGKERVQHRLVVIAPAYHSYRHTLVVALHNPHLPYPAEVRAEALAEQVVSKSPFISVVGPSYDTVYPRAHDDEQMQTLVRRALQSQQTMAAILSLIAKSNEARAAPPPAEQGRTGDPNTSRQESPPTDSETDPKQNE